MKCDFLDWRGSILGNWYCKKKDNYLDKATVNNYCDNSLHFRDCPIFKQSSSSSCYLTTAMCEILGNEDNCEELETLRDFRDNYMKKDRNYETLLEDYSLVGPYISGKLLNDENKVPMAYVMKYFYIA